MNAMDYVNEGDLFCCSWGYDQTNVDYYVVSRKTKAMIELSEIGVTVTQEGNMSGTARPDPSKVLGVYGMKRPKAYKSGDEIRVYVRMNSYSSASKVAADHSNYVSWYA